MRIKKLSAGKLRGIVISIKAIRYDGEANGFKVQVSRPNQSVKYIYKFPTDRVGVLNAVLTQIGNELANPIGRRR